MKSYVLKKYGPPSSLIVDNVLKPKPKANEVLVKVFSFSINPLDWHIMRGTPYLMRTRMGLFRPKFDRLGADFAGIISAVGESVTNFKVGDEVFGISGFRNGLGAMAEYVCVDEAMVVAKPVSVTYEEAAGVPIAAVTALQGLKHYGKLKSHERVLINGASGGVGSFAVQLARVYGAEVTAVCSTRNLSMVKQLGANRCIDYTLGDFVSKESGYDLVLDVVGNLKVNDFKLLLSKNGRAIVVGFTSVKNMLSIQFRNSKKPDSDGHTFQMVDMDTQPEDLHELANYLAKGKLITTIDRCYTFDKTPEAIAYLEEGHARGKVVINI